MAISKVAGRQCPLVARVEFTAADFAGNGAYIAVDLPYGAIVTGGGIEVTTAFDSTTNTADVGIAGGTADAFTSAPVDLKTLGGSAFNQGTYVTYSGAQVAITYAETGAAATAGAGVLYVEYVREDRADEVEAVRP